MLTDNTALRFAEVLTKLPALIDSHRPLPSELRIETDGRYEIYYAPFDHVNETAKIVLVGITPGRSQALEAIRAARNELAVGASLERALMVAKNTASFAGAMRKNLVMMLDHLGVAKSVGIDTTADLWGARPDLVHFTSALRYPVFECGENYSGAGIVRSELFRRQMDSYFAKECLLLKDALFVPLGAAAQEACDYLCTRGVILDGQILKGVPHPSGANAERVAYFLGSKQRERLSAKTDPGKIEAGKAVAQQIVRKWSMRA